MKSESSSRPSQKTLLALEKLETRRITPERELPRMEFLFRLFDTPCFPRGELVGVTGKAKSGKTFVTSMLMAACASGRALAFECPQPLRVLWFDTEQSEESTQDILVNRILRMAGEDSPPWYDVFNVRVDPWDCRLPLLEAAVPQYAPDLVILDGIRDLVSDINDGVMAQDVIERLMHLAQDCRCCIVCVLHQNKSSEDHNLRGWIGTELTNKAFEVYACEKDASRVFSLEQSHTRKYDMPDTMRFTVGDDGLPCLTTDTGTPAVRTSPTMNRKYVTDLGNGKWKTDLQALFGDALRGGAVLGHQQLHEWMAANARLTQLHYRARLITEAVNAGLVVKDKNSSGHTVYYLPKPAEADMFSPYDDGTPF